MTKAILFIAILVPCLLWAGDVNDGKLYKSALEEAIRTADRIVVTEHSCRSDFPLNEEGKQVDHPQFEYGRTELSESAKASFLRDVIAMDATTEDIFSACIFEPHHTIAFYSGSSLKSTMEICYHCGQVEWDGTKYTRPKGIFSPLTPLIKGAGFHTDRDWAALAKKAESTRH